MHLVVDTNILFSFFWKDSITKKIIETIPLTLISPEISIRELKKYSKEISKKTKISNKEFEQTLSNLIEKVKIVEKNSYARFMKEAETISPDKEDSEFFALCMKESCPLWSNDYKLKNQSKIQVITTEELIQNLL